MFKSLDRVRGPALLVFLRNVFRGMPNKGNWAIDFKSWMVL